MHIAHITDTCCGDVFPEELLLHLLQTHKERKFKEVVISNVNLLPTNHFEHLHRHIGALLRLHNITECFSSPPSAKLVLAHACVCIVSCNARHTLSLLQSGFTEISNSINEERKFTI